MCLRPLDTNAGVWAVVRRSACALHSMLLYEFLHTCHIVMAYIVMAYIVMAMLLYEFLYTCLDTYTHTSIMMQMSIFLFILRMHMSMHTGS